MTTPLPLAPLSPHPRTERRAEEGGDYRAFLASKRLVAPNRGRSLDGADLSPLLFGFQRDLVLWALRKGRAALFADTGLGKTPMQLEWAHHAAPRSLILAPLAVARQTVREAQKFGRSVTYARSMTQAPATGITITNYEMLDHFDPTQFGAVVLDESSILANFTGITKQHLVETCRSIPMRLCCTATPAPNDTVELCNHADFLGLMSPSDMLTTFFISKGDDQKDKRFRLKSHARRAFFRWLASWSMSLKKPSDLGYADDGFLLPPLHIAPVVVESSYVPSGYLFPTRLKGVTDRSAARRGTLADRVAVSVERIQAEPDQQWLVWYGLIDEGKGVTQAIPDAVMVRGSDAPDVKADALAAFADGRIRVLVTHPDIAGFGMNFQGCARLLFVGIGDSYQTYYQALRRCWRFGQTRAVEAFIVLSDIEIDIYNNVLRKEKEAADLSRDLIAHVAEFERSEIGQVERNDDAFEPHAVGTFPPWLTTERNDDQCGS